jgi:palmitoyltransferase ZDHHC2/15/20
MLNWSYTTAVFTPPGSTTNNNGYSTLPTHVGPNVASLTVKSNGEMRFCKKCQARKPDRAHHCSTCRRCVLKMDHHCPWLATCIGLRNHKAFLLFLIYTTFFSLFAFAVSGSWVYAEILNETTYVESLVPVQYIMLAVISGIIALVVGAFTAWHIMLASRGQTTIECLEKTRYLSPLRKQLQSAFEAQHSGRGVPLPRYGQQLLDMHQNAVPGFTRPEEGESRSPTPLNNGNNYLPHPDEDDDPSSPRGPEAQMGRRLTYDDLERYRARKRYEEYLDEQDSSKLPNAFDLGVRRNLAHLFGPSPFLWFFPICNTTGDGWTWEASPSWTAARDRLRSDRDEQRARERAAGWGAETPLPSPGYPSQAQRQAPQHVGAMGSQLERGAAFLPVPTQGGGGPASGRRSPSKADRVLGRDPNAYADEAVSMRRLSPSGRAIADEEAELAFSEDEDDDDIDDILGESAALNSNRNIGGWDGAGGPSGLLRKASNSRLVRSPTGRREEADDEVD